MKRHIRDSKGRLLQVDKGWKNLKTKQQDWIADELRTRYLKAYESAGGEPSKQTCDEIVWKVCDIIEKRGVWLPGREVFAYFSKKKRHWLKKYLQRKEAELQQAEVAGIPLSPLPNEPYAEPGKES